MPRVVLGRELVRRRRVVDHGRGAPAGERRPQDRAGRGRRALDLLAAVDQPLRAAEPVLEAVAVAVDEMGRGRRERERRVRGDLLGAHAGEPGPDAADAAVGDAGGGDRPQPRCDVAVVAGGERVADGLVEPPLALVPCRGSPVQVGGPQRIAPALLGPEHLGEQRVVAELVVRPVERHERDARARELPEQRPRAGRAGQPVAGGARQPRQDGGAQQERDGGQGERGQDLVAQVVGHQPVVAGEGGDGRAAIVPAPDRERGDVERGGPALRALQQRGEIGGLELDPRHAQHRGRLPARHRELRGAQLDDEPLRAQGAERQRRLAPGGDRQLRSRGQLARPRLELGRSRLDVDAVEDGHGRRRRRVEGHRRALERAGPRRDPGERPVVALGPLAEQRRLAVARRRADDHERRVARLQQRADEPVAAHRAAADAGSPAGEGDGRRRRWEGEGRSCAHAPSIPGPARHGEGARRRSAGRRTAAPGWCPHPGGAPQ